MAASSRTYEIHGVTLASPLELAARPSRAGASPDYTVVLGERRAAGGPPGPEHGELTAKLETAGLAYWLSEREDGSLLIRYHELAEFVVHGSIIRCHLAPDSPNAYASILLAGDVVARILTRRGRLVLHASAIEFGGRAIAVLGASGAGKSTTAAHLCAAGAPLITDDTLAVSIEGVGADEAARCYAGTSTIRLRPSSLPHLGEQIEAWIGGESADGRLIASPPLGESSSYELAAAVVLERGERGGEMAVERLSGQRAATGLLSNPRSSGWVAPARLRGQFEASTRLAGLVPVLAATVPAERAVPGLGTGLLTAIGAALGKEPAVEPAAISAGAPDPGPGSIAEESSWSRC